MKENFYVYNNEAIAICILLAVLDKVKSINIARLSLFLPILLDDRVVIRLARNRNIFLENFINENLRLFINFDKKYVSLLPVFMNSLTLLKGLNKISIENSFVKYQNAIDFNKIMSDRFERVESVIPVILFMIDYYSTEELFSILKVKL